ncbi:hypothetical protein ACHAPE_009708 [Trichoderma viride]
MIDADHDVFWSDHDTFWADDEGMKEKAKAYAKRAAAVAKEMLFELNHPWKQDAHHSPWRFRFIDLERGCRSLSCDNEFEKARDLLLDWESTRKKGGVGERNRCVILLEDLSPRIAELLGVLLDIPPDFFLFHSKGYGELSVVDKQLSKRGRSKYWKVAVPQMRSLPQTGLPPATERGSYQVACGSFVRDTDEFKDHTIEFNFDSHVSYWANSYGHGSWIEFSDDSFSATCVVRNCIGAVWEQQVRNDELNILGDVYRNVWNHKVIRSSRSSGDFEEGMALNNETMSEYQQLMGTQQNIRLNRHSIREIIHKFRPRDSFYLAEKTSKIENHMKDEIESWKFLDQKLQYVEESLNNHMKMYSARSAMEETYEAKMQSRESMKQTKEANRQTAAANRMARSSGQLTKIATIIVPCTFVGSIFSMGGDFAAGESLFYVYWIISVPITVGLLSWILHEDIAGAVEKSRGWFTSKRTKLSKGSVSEGSLSESLVSEGSKV